MKNAEFYFGDRYKLDILSKQYETIEDFAADNKELVEKLKTINTVASQRARDHGNGGKSRKKQSHTE